MKKVRLEDVHYRDHLDTFTDATLLFGTIFATVVLWIVCIK